MIQATNSAIPPAARTLGYAGVLPFIALALVPAFRDQGVEAQAVRGFLTYSAVILSFLGGVRWGVATRFERVQWGALIISVVPSLWAFACLWWPNPIVAVWGLMLGFAAMGLADWLLPAPGSAAWMIVLRARLSLAVIACHAILIVSLMVS
jgi:hypothetical protein